MADLYRTGNIIGRQHADDARQGLGPFRVNGLYNSSRVRTANGAAIAHVRQIDVIQIVGIFSRSQYLGLDVDALAGIADTAIAPDDRNRCIILQQFRRQGNGIDDLLIPRTAANIVADSRCDFQSGRLRIGIDKSLASHDHPGNAEAALNGASFTKSIDEDVFFPL